MNKSVPPPNFGKIYLKHQGQLSRFADVAFASAGGAAFRLLAVWDGLFSVCERFFREAVSLAEEGALENLPGRWEDLIELSL